MLRLLLSRRIRRFSVGGADNNDLQGDMLLALRIPLVASQLYSNRFHLISDDAIGLRRISNDFIRSHPISMDFNRFQQIQMGPNRCRVSSFDFNEIH